MKKNLFRTVLFAGALALMSFDNVESSGAETGEAARRPMFGGSDECMPAIIMPNGSCTQECRHHTYIFWIDFVGEWKTERC